MKEAVVRKLSFCFVLSPMHPRQRRACNRALMLGAAALLAIIVAIPDGLAAGDDHAPGTRVQSWAVGHTSLLAADIAEFDNQTVREVVHTSVEGSQVRVRIANTFG